MKGLKTILGVVLATAGLGSAVAVGATSASNQEQPRLAEAGSSNYKIVGMVSSLNLTGFTYADGHAMANGGSDNVATLLGVTLTQGDVFKLTDNSSWLGFNNKDGYGAEANTENFYYAAQANKIWEGTNLYWKSDNKTCTGSWGTYGSTSFVDGGTGQITVRMKPPVYDYGGTYWTTGGATTWIQCGSTKWSSSDAKKGTDGNVQTWEFSFSLSNYSNFKFLRSGTSYDTYDAWGAETDQFSCESVFCGDKNFYVRKTGVYDIYITNQNKVYIEDASARANGFAQTLIDSTKSICETGTTSDDHFDALNVIWSPNGGEASQAYELMYKSNSWNGGTYLNKINDDLFRIYDVYFTDNDAFKVRVKDNWDQAWPGSDYAVNSAGIYRIDFVPSTGSVTCTQSETLAHKFNSLSGTAKGIFASGTGDVSNAFARYSHIVSRYSGLEDFVGGVRSPSRFISFNNNETGLFAIVLSVVMVASLAGTFIVLRKKEER